VQSKWTPLDIGLFIVDLISMGVVLIVLWAAQRNGDRAKADELTTVAGE
jgi:hypothetical protein